MLKGKLSGKMYRWLLIAVATCIAFSCSPDHTDDGDDASDRLPLILKVDSGMGVDAMEDGSTVGVFLVDKTTGEAFRKNEMLIVDAGGTLMQGRDTVVPPETAMYDFFAYSPYDSGWDEIAGSVIEFDVKADQTAHLDQVASDLMLSYRIDRKEDHDEIVFRHVMAMVTVHITDRTGTFDMRFSSALLDGLKLRSYIYMAEGTCQTADDLVSDIVCTPLQSIDRRASFSAVVPPQELPEDGLDMHFMIGDMGYDFTVSDLSSLSGGKVHVFNLRMTERGLEMEDTTVTDWEDAGGGNMTVAFE